MAAFSRSAVAGIVFVALFAVQAIGVSASARADAKVLEHARTRQQFGRPIGAYQSVSHRCADMLLDVESARSAVLCCWWPVGQGSCRCVRSSGTGRRSGATPRCE